MSMLFPNTYHVLFSFCFQDLSQYGEVDGYLLVFSITSKPSYYYVKDILEKFQEDTEQRHLATILVANKGDLVRKRAVSENGKICNFICSPLNDRKTVVKL